MKVIRCFQRLSTRVSLLLSGGCWGRGGFVFTGDAPFVSFTRPDTYRRWVLLADSPDDLLVDRHFSFSHRVANSYISIIATILVEQCLAVIPQTCWSAPCFRSRAGESRWLPSVGAVPSVFDRGLVVQA